MSVNKYTPNNNPTLAAVSNADGETTVYPYADPVTHELLVKSTSGTGASADEVKITDGTNIVNVLKSDGTAVGQNAELVAGTYLSVPFTTTTQQALIPTDVGNYRYVSVHQTVRGTNGNLQFQTSNDNVTWVTNTLMIVASSVSSQSQGNTTTTGMFSGVVGGRYFRLNEAGITAGTTSGTVYFTALPSTPMQSSATVAQAGTWTVGANSATGSAVPANAFYLGVNNLAGNLSGLSTLARIAGDGTGGDTSLGSGILIWNGVNYDRQRGNTTSTVIASGTTSTQTDIALTTYNASKLIVLVNITAGAGSVTVTVDGLSTGGASYRYNILTSTALSGTGTTALRIFPGATPVANLAVNDIVPRSVRITATVSGSITYGIDNVLSV